jgi:hypothetical protein
LMAIRAPVDSAPRQAPRPRLRLIPGKAARQRSYVHIVFLVVLTVFGVAAIQAWVGQDGLHVASLEREVAHEQERLTLLRAQLAQLSTPERIRAEADRLGLVADPDPTYLRAPLSNAHLMGGWGPAAGSTRGATKRLTTPLP